MGKWVCEYVGMSVCMAGLLCSSAQGVHVIDDNTFLGAQPAGGHRMRNARRQSGAERSGAGAGRSGAGRGGAERSGAEQRRAEQSRIGYRGVGWCGE